MYAKDNQILYSAKFSQGFKSGCRQTNVASCWSFRGGCRLKQLSTTTDFLPADASLFSSILSKSDVHR